jgi:LuxR family transcriptional regulator, maltose regulon positive regulatory protein
MTQPPDISLAATKLRPPTLPECLVQRSHLDEMLDAGISPQMRLILASAPAGSGKSTLLASWLAGRPETVAWLQLEQSDADPARFWMYFVGVLVLQSRYAPRALGYLLIAAGAAYVTDTAANTLLGNYADYETLFIVIVAVPSIIAEG